MAQVTTVACDACGKIKGATNHWFILLFTGVRIQITASVNTEIMLERGESFPPIMDLCGADCVARKVSELLPDLGKGAAL